MSDDHVKRFRLSLNQPHKPFNQSAAERLPIRDKDNAQPVIPPPRTTFIPHPQLAPPGAVGIRLAQDARKFMDAKREERANDREFKPLVKGIGKDRGWER
ncbi:hypothetical protein [Sphingomonas colocasiae]|uniref:Uncharacterized protein n=1 Tax=Sphingomonas colocasiae TaxID=1848973 RepID=A0ABS7PSK5_9SPHN|nr:hypothetical protein [Sphingomonas colocasiae]MBY8824278.1 hypothetical protein [Sphingomonas colocasiae]